MKKIYAYFFRCFALLSIFSHFSTPVYAVYMTDEEDVLLRSNFATAIEALYLSNPELKNVLYKLFPALEQENPDSKKIDYELAKILYRHNLSINVYVNSQDPLKSLEELMTHKGAIVLDLIEGRNNSTDELCEKVNQKAYIGLTMFEKLEELSTCIATLLSNGTSDNINDFTDKIQKPKEELGEKYAANNSHFWSQYHNSDLDDFYLNRIGQAETKKAEAATLLQKRLEAIKKTKAFTDSVIQEYQNTLQKVLEIYRDLIPQYEKATTPEEKEKIIFLIENTIKGVLFNILNNPHFVFDKDFLEKNHSIYYEIIVKQLPEFDITILVRARLLDVFFILQNNLSELRALQLGAVKK